MRTRNGVTRCHVSPVGIEQCRVLDAIVSFRSGAEPKMTASNGQCGWFADWVDRGPRAMHLLRLRPQTAGGPLACSGFACDGLTACVGLASTPTRYAQFK
jgi:hypothetical protein